MHVHVRSSPKQQDNLCMICGRSTPKPYTLNLGTTGLLISVSQGSAANAMADPSEGTMKRSVAQPAEDGPDKAKRTVRVHCQVPALSSRSTLLKRGGK